MLTKTRFFCFSHMLIRNHVLFFILKAQPKSYGYFNFFFPYKTRGPSAWDDAEEQFSSDRQTARELYPEPSGSSSHKREPSGHCRITSVRLGSALRSLAGQQRGCAGHAGPTLAPHLRILSLKSQVCVRHRSLKEILYPIKILLCSIHKVSAKIQRTLQFPVEFLELCFLSR